MVTGDSHNFSWEGMMSFHIRHSPMASYFCPPIIFLPPLILHHAPCWCDCHTPHWCDLPHDHHWLYPIPITLSAWHHIVDVAYDLQTTQCYFPFLVPFLLPDAPCHRPTDHKPSCHAVRTLPSVSPHTNLVLVFTYHLYLKLLYLPWKEGSFPPRIQT